MWEINIIFDATTNTRWKSTIVKMTKIQNCNIGQTQNLFYWTDIAVSSWTIKRHYSSNSGEEWTFDIPFTWTQDKAKGVNIEKLPKIKFWIKKLNTRHIFWSWLITCVNMKWIWLVLWKVQSGHEALHRRTDGRTDEQGETRIPNHFRWAGSITWN